MMKHLIRNLHAGMAGASLFSVIILLMVIGVETRVIAQADTATWKKESDNIGRKLRHATVFTIGKKAYVVTGIDTAVYNESSFVAEVWEFDSEKNTWTRKGDFPGGARFLATGFSIGTTGYLGTGWSGGGMGDFWEYNPAKDMWLQDDDLPGGPRYGAVGFSIGNKGYIAFGQGSGYFKDCWEYDPTTESWKQKANFNVVSAPVGSYSVAFVIKGVCYIGSGVHADRAPDQSHREFFAFDPAANFWSRKEDIAVGSDTNNRAYGCAFAIGSKGYVGTGQKSITAAKGPFYSDLLEYTPATDSWKVMQSFPGNARQGAVGFSIGQKGYIGLGSDNSTVFSDMWSYTVPISIVVSEEHPVGTGMMSIYPNPVEEKCSIDVTLPSNDNVVLRITNILGATVYEERVSGVTSWKKELDVRGYAKGFYHVFIGSSRENFSRSIVVQ